jgi:hypothetical protein
MPQIAAFIVSWMGIVCNSSRCQPNFCNYIATMDFAIISISEFEIFFHLEKLLGIRTGCLGNTIKP